MLTLSSMDCAVWYRIFSNGACGFWRGGGGLGKAGLLSLLFHLSTP
jgi:hypothetical protein